MEHKSTKFYNMQFVSILYAIVLFLFNFSPALAASEKLTKVVLGTDWFAQAEHGGYYQAVADGTYKKFGLNVEIKMGGPQMNGMQMLLAGETDFFMPASYVMLKAGQKKLPVISVAAVFQKDLQILMAHPNTGHDTFESLKGKPIYISPTTAASVWGFLEGKYGYTEDQKRPFSHSLAPFLNDKNAVQEGLLTSEPFVIEKQTKMKPVILLFSNHGFSAYGELLTCRKKYEKEHANIVQKFVTATMIGWAHYLKDPKLGNVLIKKDNPEMTDDLLAFALTKFREMEIINGGDAQVLGLGAMTDKRWKDFYDMLLSTNSIEPDIDIKSLYTTKYLKKEIK